MEFRRFIGDNKITECDFDWITKLRSPYTIKQLSPNIKEPSFYQNDLEKYKLKVIEDRKMIKDNSSYSIINVASNENVFRAANNPSKINFSNSLRKELYESSKWRCLNFSPQKDSLNKNLPPLNVTNNIIFNRMNSIKHYDTKIEVGCVLI